ncbi:hypothetical protein [Citrobacter freundii]|uniref:hypothetical protein n=1 Tax=Citrobacter freundii TaxID=546 RepID=UPI0029D4B6C7|nr:hypothetical protein [Citrobacter freundii]MDX6980338.1 hypothetical protein [Citrobacter freundii]
MTTNHPAHGPASLDRLHQISEILSKAAAQSDGGNLGYAMADAVKVIDSAIASFGAEPVAWLHSDNGIGIPAITRSRNVADSWFSKGWNIKPLYTTPPATVSFPNEVSWEDVPEEITEDDMELALAWAHGFNQCRSAMIHAGNFREISNSSTNQASLNSNVTIDCWCHTFRPVTMSDMRFVVCPGCGNKRCPHANDHRNACTGSNEPGQIGSAYPAAPQQEVKSALEHGMQRYAGAMQKLVEGGD